MHVQVKLCDARSGAFTHNLTGHRQAVWAAAWSPSSQWHLATGGCDGQVALSVAPACPAALQSLLLSHIAWLPACCTCEGVLQTSAGAGVGHPEGGLHRAAGPARQPALGRAAGHAHGGRLVRAVSRWVCCHSQLHLDIAAVMLMILVATHQAKHNGGQR